MARIVSLSLDEKTWDILEKIPKKQRSKFVREAVQMDNEFLTPAPMIIRLLKTKQLEVYELINYTKKLMKICEAQA
jgi:hypothetical protein